MDIQREITTWAAETFPDATMDDIAHKFGDEVAELFCDAGVWAEHGEVADELADVAILLYQIADRCGVDLDTVVREKMETNRARTWERLDDGTWRHVEAGK